MKKRWICPLALALTVTVCACGNRSEAEPSAAPEPTETVTESVETPTPSNTELGKGSFDTYAVAFVGAETFTADDGSDALRVYFDFMNLSNEAVSAAEWLSYSAVQDGKTLSWAQSAEPLDVEKNLSLHIQPGTEIRCVLQYALLSDSTVAVMLGDSSGRSVSALLPLHQLPGVPEEGETATDEMDSVELTTDLPAECTLFELYTVALTGGQTENTANGRTLCVSFDFTNRSNPETIDVWDNLWLYAYQDGVQLEIDTAMGADFYAPVANGETASCVVPFLLRSDRPVLVEVYGLRETTPSAALVVPVE